MRNKAISFFRKHVAGKGTTAHNGRGAWEMEFDLTDAQVWDNVYKVLYKHADKIEEVVIDKDSFYISLYPEFSDGGIYVTLCVHYTSWGTGDNTINLYVVM